jgi:predicted CXXCH cytochrome family protein
VTRPATTSTTPHREGGRVGLRAALIAILAGAATWGGCSAEKRYGVLSFFFDGVPAPGAGYGVSEPGAPEPPGAVLVASAHSAFTEERCSECHGETAAFGLVATGFGGLESDSCLPCHEEPVEADAHVHGPVAANECLWCHRAHESEHAYLLVKASPEMCLDCHRFEMRGPRQPPEHTDLERDCLDCHLGHQAKDRYLLRPPDAWRHGPAEPGSPERPIEPKRAGETDME